MNKVLTSNFSSLCEWRVRKVTNVIFSGHFKLEINILLAIVIGLLEIEAKFFFLFGILFIVKQGQSFNMV